MELEVVQTRLHYNLQRLLLAVTFEYFLQLDLGKKLELVQGSDKMDLVPGLL